MLPPPVGAPSDGEHGEVVARGANENAPGMHSPAQPVLAVAVVYAKAMETKNARFLEIRTREHAGRRVAEVYQHPAGRRRAVSVPCQEADVREAQGIVSQSQPRESLLVTDA